MRDATSIQVRGLGKSYRIGELRAGYRTLRETISDAVRRPAHRIASVLTGGAAIDESETFWALRDVTFNVAQGEILGIIGRNGSGKSTLLKILSRITEPTEGEATIDGRVGSLLEVGTGFHPELTGRENIFLNGSVLGMSRREVAAKFDDIVGFAEVERFIDTPVKRYSSGMYVRLAFAVAAHLEPEILLVDEVLAVGDASFQRKCIEKMSTVAEEGRTVLFVSHNMAAVRNLCHRALWLDDGRIVDIGDVEAVTGGYLEETRPSATLDRLSDVLAAVPEDPAIRIDDIVVRQDGMPTAIVLNARPVEVEVHYTVRRREDGLRVYVDLINGDGVLLVRTFHDEHDTTPASPEPGSYVSVARIPDHLLAPRTYEVRVHATVYNVRSCTPGGIGFPLEVEGSTGINRAYPAEPIRAGLQPHIKWRTSAGTREPSGTREVTR